MTTMKGPLTAYLLKGNRVLVGARNSQSTEPKWGPIFERHFDMAIIVTYPTDHRIDLAQVARNGPSFTWETVHKVVLPLEGFSLAMQVNAEKWKF